MTRTREGLMMKKAMTRDEMIALSKTYPTLRWQFRATRKYASGIKATYWQTMAPNKKPNWLRTDKDYRLMPVNWETKKRWMPNAEIKAAVQRYKASVQEPEQHAKINVRDILHDVVHVFVEWGLVDFHEKHKEMLDMDMTPRNMKTCLEQIKKQVTS